MKPTAEIPKNKAQFDPFAGPEIECVVHTTQAQEEIWAACQLGGADANRAYNESVSLILKGTVCEEALEKALQKLVQRHESLRAVFSPDGRFMSIFTKRDIDFSILDYSDLAPERRKESVSEYLNDDAHHIFDLIKGPLFKAGLIKTDALEHQLVLTAHHIICDGWSIGIMLQELGALYSAHLENQEANLPRPKSFREFSDAQHLLTTSKEYGEIEQFWLKEYEESTPQLDLPTDFLRPSARSYKSERLDFPLSSDLLTDLKNTGVKAGSSFVATLLTTFELFIYQRTGQTDFAVGLPAAGQSVSGMTQLVGHCANLLPLRSSIDTDLSFIEYLKKRKSTLFDAYDHQQLSFGHLLQKLPIARDVSRIPLVPVVFNMDIGMTDGVAFKDLEYELISNPRAYEAFEIFLNASGSEKDLLLEWSYNTSLFKPETIEAMMISFEKLLRELISAPNASLATLFNTDYVSAYRSLNSTESTYPEETLHALISKQAVAKPNRTALKFHNTETTYEELEEKANQKAYYLKEQGVSSGDFVGVCLPRCSELLTTLLAILKCGGAYLPLDATYPQARIEYMLEDSEAKFLITTKELSNSYTKATQHIVLEEMLTEAGKFPDSPLSTIVPQDSVAYLLYTSGSTGKPKGVPVTHRSLINMLYSIAKEPGINENDRFLAITTISFDIAGVELYLPLLNGACVVLADTQTARDSRLLLETLEKEDITILQATPSTWQMLLDANWNKHLKLKAFCGGEALSPVLARRLLDKCESLWNMYGPTETAVYTLLKRIFLHDTVITIGKPIANTQVYIVNDQGKLAPRGTVGELVIAGDGVANGYWKRPDLSAEKFVENTFYSDGNSKLYKSGDLARLLPNGEIECLGRVDHQVKIRGHRIEPGEIEKVLTNLENIKSAVVLEQSDQLVAFVIPFDNAVSNTEQIAMWRGNLFNSLPDFLVPQDFRILNEFPTTPNGKLDRQALLNTHSDQSNVPKKITVPRSKTEKLMADIWKDCLNLEKVDIYSNFFELGGHSLLAMQVMVRIEKQTGKRLPLAALFEYSTIAKLAGLLDTDNEEISGDSLVPIQPNGHKPPLYLIHGVGLNTLKFNDLVQNLDSDQPVYGLQGMGITTMDHRSITVEEIAAHYVATITEANPNGPYALAGHSFGGIISYEMARQLQQLGKKVSMLAMLDSYVEPYFYYASPLGKMIGKLHFHFRKKTAFLNGMFSSWEDFKIHLNRKKEYLVEQKFKSDTDLTEEERLENRRAMEVEKMNALIMKRYHLVPENFEIDLFRAEKPLFFMHDPVYLGWRNIPLEGLNIYDVPGDHLDMFEAPHDVIFAKILQGVLDYRNTEQ